MTEIRFYHLQHTRLEQALAKILDKALTTGHRAAVVKTASAAAAEQLAEQLWSFHRESFLPHGTSKDGYGPDQPIWLTANDDVPNGAKLLILTGGAVPGDLAGFDLCCEILDEGDPAMLEAARQRWKQYQQAGHSLTYWQQNERGGWDKKAEA